MLNMASHDDFFSACPVVSELAEEHPISMLLLACWILSGEDVWERASPWTLTLLPWASALSHCYQHDMDMTFNHIWSQNRHLIKFNPRIAIPCQWMKCWVCDGQSFANHQMLKAECSRQFPRKAVSCSFQCFMYSSKCLPMYHLFPTN